jgi:hypothetical protein
MKTEAEIKEKIKSLEESLNESELRHDYDVDPKATFRKCVRMSGKRFLEWVIK